MALLNDILVSVIIPCRNEQDHIERAIRSILDQDYPGPIEVFVVDGMSQDRTLEVVRAIEVPKGRSVVTLPNPGLTAPTGLNICLHQVCGTYVMRLDGHTWVGPSYIRVGIESLLERPQVACVGGRIFSVGHTPTTRAIAASLESVFGVGNSKFRTSTVEQVVDTVAFGIYRRSVFEQAGPFDERLTRNQDIEYNRRLQRLGYQILLKPAMKGYYAPRSTFGGLWKQNFNNGMWNVKTTKLAPGSLSLRHWVPGAFVFFLFSGAFLMWTWWGRWLYTGTIGLYAVLLAMFTFRTRQKVGTTGLVRVALSFLTLHVSQGFGMLWGGLIMLPELIASHDRR